jgi:hypothetical protein
MVFFPLDFVLAFTTNFQLRRTVSTPHCKSMCGLVQRKKSSFINWTLSSGIDPSRMDAD